MVLSNKFGTPVAGKTVHTTTVYNLKYWYEVGHILTFLIRIIPAQIQEKIHFYRERV